MDIGSIFLILALLIPVAIFIIRPLIEPGLVAAFQTRQDLSSLLAERDHVIATIQELDDDYYLGKIPASDYPPQRLTLLQNGVDVLRKIDEFQAAPAHQAIEDRLEAAIANHRQSQDAIESHSRKNGNAVPPVPDDELEQKIASHRRAMQGKAGGFCPKCGRPFHAADRFCSHCGATLA